MKVYNLTDRPQLVEGKDGKLERIPGNGSKDYPREDALRILAANGNLSAQKGEEVHPKWTDPDADGGLRGEAVPTEARDVGPAPTPQGDTVDADAIAADLRGDALDEALTAAGLPKTGTADEKRARYAAYLTEATNPAPAGEEAPEEPRENA